MPVRTGRFTPPRHRQAQCLMWSQIRIYIGTFARALSFGLRLSAVENVLQTIAHEVAHHAGLGHADVSLHNREYSAIKNYRAQL